MKVYDYDLGADDECKLSVEEVCSGEFGEVFEDSDGDFCMVVDHYLVYPELGIVTDADHAEQNLGKTRMRFRCHSAERVVFDFTEGE